MTSSLHTTWGSGKATPGRGSGLKLQQISVKHHFSVKEPMHSTWFVDVWWLARSGHIQESVSAYRGEDGEEWCFKIADMVWARYPHGNSRDSNFMFFPMPSSPFWDVKRAPFLLGNRVRVCMETRWWVAFVVDPRCSMLAGVRNGCGAIL